jgi:protein involved in polysaccharide export with SLBB domain
VATPGVYVFHPYDRVWTAIAFSGGPLPGASLRRIVVTGPDGSRSECDLVRFALLGDLDQNPVLVQGATVNVPPARDFVRVTGAVHGLPGLDRGIAPNPGARVPEAPNILLEWKEGDTAGFAITRAGGLSEDATGQLLLVRGSDRRVLRASGADSVALEPGDLLEVGVRERWVFVNGAVRYPGPYPYLPTLAAADYVRIAGGPTEIGRGNGWSLRLAGSSEKVPIGKASDVPPGSTIWVPERWTYKTSTLLAPISGITALIISLVALRR